MHRHGDATRIHQKRVSSATLSKTKTSVVSDTQDTDTMHRNHAQTPFSFNHELALNKFGIVIPLSYLCIVMRNQSNRIMNNQLNRVSSATLSEKIIKQLMTFNKCTPERAVCMYKEMMQTIADFYLMDSVSSATLEIEAFAENVCTSYGLIETHTNELIKKLC